VGAWPGTNDGDRVNPDGHRTGFPGALGGLYGPVKGVLSAAPRSLRLRSVPSMVRAAPVGQATSETALRMACSNASGGWAPVIR
jgi:hypothetical protein